MRNALDSFSSARVLANWPWINLGIQKDKVSLLTLCQPRQAPLPIQILLGAPGWQNASVVDCEKAVAVLSWSALSNFHHVFCCWWHFLGSWIQKKIRGISLMHPHWWIISWIPECWILYGPKGSCFIFSCCAHPSSTCPVVFLGLSRETASILARWMQLPRRQRVKLVAVLMVKIYLDSLRQLGSWFICLRKNCLNIIHTKGLQCEHWTSLSSPGVKKKRRNKLEDQVEIDAFSAFGTSH